MILPEILLASEACGTKNHVDIVTVCTVSYYVHAGAEDLISAMGFRVMVMRRRRCDSGFESPDAPSYKADHPSLAAATADMKEQLDKIKKEAERGDSGEDTQQLGQ